MSSASNEKLTDIHRASEDMPYRSGEVDYQGGKDDFDVYDEEYGHATEKQPRFYKTKRFWVKCIVILIVVLAIFIPVVLLVVLPKMVQSIVNGSSMSMHQLNMTDATETGMKVSLTGGIDNAGIFPATIDFPEPIIVSWEGRQLGSMVMSSVKATGGKASIVDSTTFSIIDKDAFSLFAKEMVTTKCAVFSRSCPVQC